MPTPSKTVRYGTPVAAASYLGGLLSARSGVAGFRERAFASGGVAAEIEWGWHRSRQLRYAVQWGHYDGSVYRAINRFADELKAAFDLYDYVRPIYNPTYRDVEFWAEHLMGGLLGRVASDGKSSPTCLPILTDNPAILDAATILFRDSNWQAKKETWTRFGAALGDAPLMVVDDPYRKKVYLRPFHPGTLARFDRDDYGNCKGYVIEEVRPSPFADPAIESERSWAATYAEVCEKVGERIVYTTYLDGEPFDWRDYPDGTPESRMVGPTWSEEYGFVPLVLAQHRDMGLGWGMAELHPTLPKLHELDDVASKLDDAIRKAVDPRWFFSGIPTGETLNFGSGDDDDDEDDSGARDAVDAIRASDPNAKAQPLLAVVNIADASAHIQTILANIERDHPELAADLAGENASGKARRVAQERVEALVIQRRAGYDDALKRAIQMGVSIGAVKGYPIGLGFAAESYQNGDLEFSFGDRAVFAVDELDKLEEATSRATVFKTLTDGGMPWGDAAEEAGYPEDRVESLRAAQQKADADKQAAADALAKSRAAVQVKPGEVPADEKDAA